VHHLTLILIWLLLARQESLAPDWGRRLQWAEDVGPAAREHAAFVADPERNRAVMLTGSGYYPYGDPLGDAWAFDFESETWTQLQLVGDDLVPGGSRRAAPVHGGTFLHGGYGVGFAALGELWRLEFEAGRIVVERLEQQNPPPARLLHAFACDAVGERFVVFGGGGNEDALDDTWIGRRTEEGVRWQKLETDHHPGKRFGFAFANDVERGRLLVCGGQIPPEDGQDVMVVARDLWALDYTAEAPAWTRLAVYESEQFHGRRNPAFTFDEKTGDLFVWGGTGDGASALPDLYVVRTRVDGAPVERLSEPDTISTRASGFGVVDRSGGRALLGFGNTGEGPFDDLVEVHLRGSAGEGADSRGRK
jgi:hypothetical protein